MLAIHLCGYQKDSVLNYLQNLFLPDTLWYYEYYSLINYLNSPKSKKDNLEYYHEHIFVINTSFILCIEKEKNIFFFPWAGV